MLRVDRLLTLYCFSFLRKTEPAMDAAIPVLMYHSVSCNSEPAVHPYYQTTTSPKMFADHMRFLSTEGYKAISMQELTEKDHEGKRVVITFDDGFNDFYFEAFPVLQRYSFQATVFLATAYVDSKPFKGRRCLNWKQIRELDAGGILFGSHTHTHRQLSNLSRSAIGQELRRSREIIEDKLGRAVTEFSYPYKFPEENSKFKELIDEELKKAGYRRGVTTTIGRYRAGDATMFIKRLPANDHDDIKFFKAKLDGAYDWLHYGQIAFKRTRKLAARIRGE